MNILILNWRDITSPTTGGAEILTHEIAKRLVKKGHSVLQFTSSYSGAKNEEYIDGVHFIRKGRWWNVHFIAFIYYIFKLRNEIDYIIDEVHWFPFFAAMYAPKKTIALTCEVAKDLFYRIFPYPIALFWRGFEKFYLYLYKNVNTLAISPSTKLDLINEGYNARRIVVLPMGITSPKNITILKKQNHLTLVFLGRLNKQKGALDALLTYEKVKKQIPDAKLWFIGSGEESYVTYLKDESERLRLSNGITFYGYVSEEKKFSLLSTAHILIVPSAQEGWGLTIPEAGLVKTPAVVYNVKGVQDIVTNTVNGILVKPNPQSLSKGVVALFKNKIQYMHIQEKAQIQAKKYSWDNTTNELLHFIQKI